MKLKKFLTAIAFVCYVLISWSKFDEIRASLISFVSYCLLTVTEYVSPVEYWKEDLLEYWIAGIVWLVGALFLVRKVRTRKQQVAEEKSTLHSISFAFLLCLAFVALTAPFIAPVRPNVQGQLTTTRLLPPFTHGVIVEVVDTELRHDNGWTIEGAFKTANAFLLQREITFIGKENSSLQQIPNRTRVRSFVFVFGTDDYGRDVFSRVVYGTRVSLAIGLFAALASVAIGTLIGFAAGYSNRIVDSVLMRFTDLALSIPSLFLVVAIVAFLGKSVFTLIVVLGLTGWMGIARTVRTEVLRLRDKEFVLAAKLLNQPTLRILKNHILRNLKPLLVVAATLQFSNAVLAEASLSFLGLGIQPPTASWGNMLGQSLTYIHKGWWLGFFPGALLALVLILSHYAVEGKEKPA